MMGDTASLPLPAAQPAATVLAAAATAPGTAGVRGGTASTREDSGTAATDAGLLFDLLLGGQPEAAQISLVSALPPMTRAAGELQQEDAPAADPLLTVLAQMPQAVPLPQVAALPMAPWTPTTPGANAAAATATATDAASLQTAALGAAQPGLGMGLPSRNLAAPAPAATTFPATGLPADNAAAATVPAAPAARFPLLQQGPASQSALADGLVPGFALPTAERAPVPVEALAPTSFAPPNVQSVAGTQPAFAPAAPIPAPVLSQPADPTTGYDDGFSGHVAWLAGQRIGHAEIRVVPEHLGAIDIRLQMDGSNVRAEFHSSQPEVRQALEASLPRLREMLGQHGMQLAHAGVGQGQGGQRQSGDGMPQPGHSGGLTLPDEAGSPLPPDFRRARGLLDVYA